jgi:uncharacterized zinc-type alcohol dehydrogenase-like protein
MKTSAYAAIDATSPLVPHRIERRDLRGNDVAIEILYCGVCHSDLHQTRGDWPGTTYPCVPGHEIVGKVVAIGGDVTRHQIGDAVAVGCIVDSCGHCDQCLGQEEQICRNGATGTYNGRDRITGDITYGGYSSHVVVREEFVLKVPASLDLARAAPLLCAGITTYSPLRTWNVGPGSRVGVIGLGGLGHMAVKLAVGLGADVTVISRTDAKAADALALGADRLLVSRDADAMAAAANGFDLIIDTIPARHDVSPYMPLLDIDATLVIVGQLGLIDETSTLPLLMGRRRLSGSPIGGIAETQEMLNFCARQNILPDCEMIAIQDINTAFERMERADVRYRFVIDMASLEAA